MNSEPFERDWHRDFDLNDATFGDDFEQVCDELVAQCPVARSDVGEGYWIVSRYADVSRILREWRSFSSADGIIGVNRPLDQPLFKPNETDPPEHDDLRRVMNPHFTAAAIEKHEPEIRHIVDGLIDRFIEDGEAEIVRQYSDSIPSLAFCQAVASMPTEDMPYLQETFHEAITGPAEQRGAEWLKGQQYMEQFLERRKNESRIDDIVDAILYFDFPDGREYSRQERAGTLAQLTAGGIETTGAVISGALHYFATHPEERARLAADSNLIKIAVEEFLRIFVPAPCLGRRVTRDVQLSGVKIPAGDYLIYNLGGANRDPSVFERPSAIDLAREPNRHLTFAAGVHHCVGLHLARLNIRIAIEIFLERIPDFRVPDGFEPHFQGGITRSMTSLELVFA